MTFATPISDLIKQRYSCRSYLDQPIEGVTMQLLADYASTIGPGPFGTQPRFKLITATDQDRKALNKLRTYGFIKGATGFIIGAVQYVDRNLEDFGYLMEKIILYATDLGLGTCWLGGTFTKSSFGKKISVKRDELVPAVTATGYPSDKRRLIERITRRKANADRRVSWNTLFFDSEFGSPLPRQDAGEFAVPLEMVRLGPSASNKQPWRVIREGDRWHFYLQRTPGYREAALVKLFTVADLQRMDMGIAMCHFELTARELGLNGHWEMKDPHLTIPDELTEFTAAWVGST